MSESANLASLLLRLLSSLSKQGTLHLSDIDADLHQTTDLLTQAIDKLGRSFIGIHESVAAQRAAIAALPDGTPMNPTLRADIAMLQEATDTHINAAVTALQFHDMTSQLIGRVAGHVGGLRDIFGLIGDDCAALASDSPDAMAAAVLHSIGVRLDEKSEKRDAAARKAVHQTHMESGDIELF